MATATIRPDGDITADWDTTVPASPATHYTSIDEDPDTPTDAEYNETVTLSDVDEVTFGTSPADVNTVTEIEINIRAGITDSSDTRVIRLELFDGATPVAGNPQDITTTDLGFNDGTVATVQKTWSTLTLTKAQADNLQLRMTFQ